MQNPPIILSDSPDLPAWAEGIADYSVFQRGNIWMMEDALLRPNADVTLLALWNGKAGDGPGGTGDMVKLAEAQGAKAYVKNTDELFDSADIHGVQSSSRLRRQAMLRRAVSRG